MKKEIIEKLHAWDNVHSAHLKEIYDAYLAHPFFTDMLIQIYLEEPSLQLASTWLLKYHIDGKNQFSSAQVSSMLSGVNTLTEWGSQLHILQIIPHLAIDKHQAVNIEPFVREALHAEKKFVKAAAIEAYFEVVRYDPALQHAFMLHCEEVLQKESAAVKVKARRVLNILEKGE